MTKPREVWPGFKESDFLELVRYFLAAAVVLELRDWEIAVERIPLETDDAYAKVSIIPGQKRARVSICREWPTLDPELRRRVVCHELIHCHTDPAQRYLEEALPELVGKTGTIPLVLATRDHLEVATDALADAVAPRLPLPV